MDTPGGLEISMREIIQDIVSSPIPIVSYVAPSGARAASAGTYILFASHIAAMAPATNLGAATPINLMSAFQPSSNEQGQDQEQDQNTQATPGLEQKIINDEVAYIRLAQLHHRNADWAEQAVRAAASISSSEALKIGVIDIIANDIPDLLHQLDNRVVIVQGQNVTLHTEGIAIEQNQPDWRSNFLAVITDPSVAYILLLIGVYGLFFEFINPGFVLPGVMGAIALLLALYAFQLLPISYAGLSLILLGIIFMVVEAFMPTFGAIGIGGIIAFAIGSVMLLGTQGPYAVPWSLIITMSVINATFIFVLVGMALTAFRRKKVSGKDALIGMIAEVREDFQDNGWVRVSGESWRAQSELSLKQGQRVRIKAVEGLVLIVEPLIVDK